MDKKEYLKPTSALIDIEIDAVMTTVSGETTGAGTGSGSSDSEDEGAGRNRGEWGSLWK
jgi:hypothetical protein